MGQAFRFITSTEVVISPWQKKPDVQLVDPSGELLTILLDVTLPALFRTLQIAVKMSTMALARRKRTPTHTKIPKVAELIPARVYRSF